MDCLFLYTLKYLIIDFALESIFYRSCGCSISLPFLVSLYIWLLQPLYDWSIGTYRCFLNCNHIFTTRIRLLCMFKYVRQQKYHASQTEHLYHRIELFYYSILSDQKCQIISRLVVLLYIQLQPYLRMALQKHQPNRT